MLDVDKQRLSVGRRIDAGDFALLRTDKEALEPDARVRTLDRRLLLLDARGIGVGDGLSPAVADSARLADEHHAIGDIGEGAIVGLNPKQRRDQPPGVLRPREPQPVGTRQVIGGVEARQIDVGRVEIGTRGEQVNIPAEGQRFGAVIGLAQADDVTVAVRPRRAGRIDIDARVGGIGRKRRAVARRAVGKRQIDLTIAGVDRSPFGPVHPCRAGGVARQPGVDQHIGLIGEGISGVGGGDVALPKDERQPHAAAIGVETRDIKRASVEILVAGGDTVGGGRVRRRPSGVGDEFVEIIARRVVAHVPGGFDARDEAARPAAFLRHPPHRGALAWHRGGIVRIDFDRIAELVDFVAEIASAVGRLGRVDGDVELGKARIVRVSRGRGRPAVIAARRCAPPIARKARLLLGSAQRQIARVAAEIARPVFLAGDVGAPGGEAVGAIVEGATARRAVWREPRPHQRMPTHRAAQLRRRQRGDAAVERR